MKKMRFSMILPAVAILLACLAPLGAQQSQEREYAISILKGPSGISGAWMMAEMPKVPGAKSSYILAASADLVVAKLVSGEISGGVLPVNVAAKLYNAKVPVKALAVVGNGMVKFLSADPAVRGFADLKGATIHIAGQKATPDYLFRYLARQYGLEAGRDYEAVYNLAYPEIAAALASGKIKNAVLPEPFATQAMQMNPSLSRPLDLTAEWKAKTGHATYPMSVFVVSEALCAQSPALVDALAKAYSRSIEKTLADPATTARLAELLNLGIKAQAAQAAIPVSSYVYATAVDARPGIEAMLGVFLSFDAQSIGGKLPDSGFYYGL